MNMHMIWPLCDHGYVSGGCPTCQAGPETPCPMAPVEPVVPLLDEFGVAGFTYPGRYGLAVGETRSTAPAVLDGL